MNTVFDYLLNLWPFTRNETEFTNHVEETAAASVSIKRPHDENCEEISLKKKKLFSVEPIRDARDPSFSSYFMKKPLTESQKENNYLMASINSKRNDGLTRSKFPHVDHHEVYCIDDEDTDFQFRRNDYRKGMDFKNMNNRSSLHRFTEIDDCVVENKPNQTSSRSGSDLCSKLCFSKVKNIRERSTYLTMVSSHCPAMRRSTPLTNSTQHNTKQNRLTSSDLFSSRSYLLRYPLISTPKLNFPISRESSVKSNESIFDKVVIDLTGNEDDDEGQRQAIESKVISSPQIRNMKSSFVAEDTFALDENLISSITKKYNTRMQKMKTRATKFEKNLQSRRDEISKTISEILEQRLTLKEHEERSEDLQQKPSEVAPITKDMVSEMNEVLKSRKYPLVQIKDTSIKVEDIKTLENTSWLNDEVINAYMNLMKQRCEENPGRYPKVHCFNTFLFEQLNKRGYCSVRRWTRKVDIFDYEILIIPIHLGNHWCLVQIRFDDKTIFYYDSMGSPNKRCLNVMIHYLIEEYKDKKKGIFDTSDWKLISVPSNELPQQRNAHDCGVFACTFAEHITRNAPFNFDQDDMQYFRIKMMYEILTGKLIL